MESDSLHIAWDLVNDLYLLHYADKNTNMCSIEPYGLLNITIPPFRRAQEEILNREWFLATSLNNQRRGEISKDTH